MGSSLAGWMEWKRHVLEPTHSLWRPLLDAEYLLDTIEMDRLKGFIGPEMYGELWEREIPDDVSPFVREQYADYTWHGGAAATWLTLTEVQPFAHSLEYGWKALYTVMTQAAAQTHGWRADEQEITEYVRIILWWYW